MNKILIFGAGGMIGHKMFRVLTAQKKYQVIGTLRRHRNEFQTFNLFNAENSIECLDVANFADVEKILNQVKPDVILNCIGITLRKPEIKNEELCKKINSDFPHFLKKWIQENNKYLIHFSTDCVFSGKDGPYTEASIPSATDTYGQTKAKGEVVDQGCLTLRGSMIGRELTGKTELLEWALSQKNKQIKGFRKAMYAGVTTDTMAELVVQLLQKPLSGLYQVSGTPISKFDLLMLINKHFNLNQVIEADDSYATEKILISDKLSQTMGFYCSDWDQMVKKITLDSFKYDIA